MLWLDKHRPRTLDKMDYHQELSMRLKKLTKSNMLPHLLFYGAPGAGKKTRVQALLRELFGPGAEKLKQDKRTFKTPSRRSVEINTVSSNYHIEISPSDAGTADTFVVQEIIKEIAQSSPLHTMSLLGNQSKAMKIDSVGNEKGNDTKSSKVNKKKGGKPSFKIVLLSDADTLSKGAQHALRRTMEKYVVGCRLILVSESINKIIPPLRSRCLCIRVPAPTEEQVMDVMKKVLKVEERINRIADENAEKLLFRIAKLSERNLRRALLLLQTCHVISMSMRRICLL